MPVFVLLYSECDAAVRPNSRQLLSRRDDFDVAIAVVVPERGDVGIVLGAGRQMGDAWFARE